MYEGVWQFLPLNKDRMSVEAKTKIYLCRDNSSIYNRPILEVKKCPFCRDKNYVSLFDCKRFKVSDPTT